MKATPVRIQYCVDLTSRQWDRLMRIDTESFKCVGKNLKKAQEFEKELEDAGAYDIEFNGHFGVAFYFTSDASTDTKLILHVLKRYIG